IEIPQYGTKHSLNVSVTAGIVIWDLFKKLR
ncbi:protein containing tRNA/rRNA methyltransferase, SpoU domain protein, partial [human gut metagenome]